jgi:catechol 2,3-dioxygenase-like lactoylglutathione lyase family enzyme
MLDHVTIGTSDLARAREFYDRALKPLGIDRLYTDRVGIRRGQESVLLD